MESPFHYEVCFHGENGKMGTELRKQGIPYGFGVKEHALHYNIMEINFSWFDKELPAEKGKFQEIYIALYCKQGHRGADTEPVLYFSDDPPRIQVCDVRTREEMWVIPEGKGVQPSDDPGDHYHRTYTKYFRRRHQFPEFWDLLIQVDLGHTPLVALIEWVMDRSPIFPEFPAEFRDRFLYLVSSPEERKRREAEEKTTAQTPAQATEAESKGKTRRHV